MRLATLLLFSLSLDTLVADLELPNLNVYNSIEEMVERKDGNVGKQIVLDLYDCETPHLDNLEWVMEHLIKAAELAGAHVVEVSFHKFDPYGISGVVVISESHLAIHIWPEFKYAALDIFTCNEALGIGTKQAADYLIKIFESKNPNYLVFTRGKGISNTTP